MKNILISMVLLSGVSAQAMKKDSSTQVAFNHVRQGRQCVSGVPQEMPVAQVLRFIWGSLRPLSPEQCVFFRDELSRQAGKKKLIDLDAANEILAHTLKLTPDELVHMKFKSKHEEISAKARALVDVFAFRQPTQEEQLMCRRFDQLRFDMVNCPPSEQSEIVAIAEKQLKDITSKAVGNTIQAALQVQLYNPEFDLRTDMQQIELDATMRDFQIAGFDCIEAAGANHDTYKTAMDRFIIAAKAYKNIDC